MGLSDCIVEAAIAVSDLDRARPVLRGPARARARRARRRGRACATPAAAATRVFVYLSPENAGTVVGDARRLVRRRPRPHDVRARIPWRGVRAVRPARDHRPTTRGVFDAGRFRAAWVTDPDGNTPRSCGLVRAETGMAVVDNADVGHRADALRWLAGAGGCGGDEQAGDDREGREAVPGCDGEDGLPFLVGLRGRPPAAAAGWPDRPRLRSGGHGVPTAPHPLRDLRSRGRVCRSTGRCGRRAGAGGALQVGGSALSVRAGPAEDVRRLQAADHRRDVRDGASRREALDEAVRGEPQRRATSGFRGRVAGFAFETLPPDAAQTYNERGRKRAKTIRFDYRVPNG